MTSGSRYLAAAQKTADELGEHCRAYALNVCERESMKAFIDGAENDLGPVGIFVNNAGIMQVGWRLWEEDDATTARMIDININGVVWGVKEIVPRMLERRRGHIVNIASSAGKGGFPGGATYCGTKHYVVGMSEALRGELRGSGLEVSCVMPVLVDTELTDGCPDTRGVKKVTPEDVANEIVAAVRENRFDVYVPRSVARITWTMNMLPRSGREAISRALKADKVLAEITADGPKCSGDFEREAAIDWWWGPTSAAHCKRWTPPTCRSLPTWAQWACLGSPAGTAW